MNLGFLDSPMQNKELGCCWPEDLRERVVDGSVGVPPRCQSGSCV